MKLLYAEDEISLSEAVVDILSYHKYTVDPVYNGRDALEYARLCRYDGIILDIMMPEIDGLEVLRRLRAEGNTTPVLLLTAKSDISDRIAGLDSGADDYLPKPFNTGELLARIRAMLRRRTEFTPDVLICGNMTLDMRSFTLSACGKSVVLPKLEYKMLELFMLNRGAYISTEDILTNVWGYDTDAEPGIVWVYISYLRKRLVSIGASAEIKARRNIGYTLEETKC